MLYEYTNKKEQNFKEAIRKTKQTKKNVMLPRDNGSTPAYADKSAA